MDCDKNKYYSIAELLIIRYRKIVSLICPTTTIVMLLDFPRWSYMYKNNIMSWMYITFGRDKNKLEIKEQLLKDK